MEGRIVGVPPAPEGNVLTLLKVLWERVAVSLAQVNTAICFMIKASFSLSSFACWLVKNVVLNSTTTFADFVKTKTNRKFFCSTHKSSLRTTDVFPVVASLPPKNNDGFSRRVKLKPKKRMLSQANTSLTIDQITYPTPTVLGQINNLWFKLQALLESLLIDFTFSWYAHTYYEALLPAALFIDDESRSCPSW